MAEKTKNERIAELSAKLEKDYGKGTLIGATDKGSNIDTVSTGSLKVNQCTGIGGFPKGRIIEVYGPESSGKTTLLLETIAEAHKDPEVWCAIIDAEHALDLGYAENLGVDLNRLKLCQPDYGEQGLNVLETLIESGMFDVIGIDSVAALTPKSEIDGEIGDANVGKQARLMSQTMRKITAKTSKSNTCVIFINQLRDKIGVLYGSPEVTTGGNALKFYASMRIDIRKTAQKDNERNATRVKVVKNKLAAPFKECEFFINWGTGIDREMELLDLAVELDVIHKSGSWYSYGDAKIGQGLELVTKFLADNPEYAQEVETKVLEAIKGS